MSAKTIGGALRSFVAGNRNQELSGSIRSVVFTVRGTDNSHEFPAMINYENPQVNMLNAYHKDA